MSQIQNRSAGEKAVITGQVADNEPIKRVLEGYGRRKARLEYLFFKFNLPEQNFALLVDLIVRRATGQVQVRISLYTEAESGQVYSSYHPLAQLKTDGGELRIGEVALSAESSRGKVGPVEWEINFKAAGPIFEPRVPLLSSLEPFDLTLRSASEVDFSGTVRVEGRQYELEKPVRGVVACYYGRALPAHWFWVSANQWDSHNEPTVLEAMVLYSALWGLPFLRLKVAYFYLGRGAERRQIIAPLNGLIGVKGSRENFTVTARPFFGGQKYLVRCQAPAATYNDLGDRIFNTLLGRCELPGVGTAFGTASLEEREPER